jgi:Asp/Glu/hydantoin racemase
MATRKGTQFDTASVEETIKRIEEMNQRMIESSKSTGRVALDAYEKALESMLDFQEKVAGASQLEWVSALASTHAQFISDVSAAYIKATRETLK